MMRNASKRISNCPRTMGRRGKQRIEVTEDNVDVVSMMTGIPESIAQTESNKLAILPELKVKLLDKEAV
jgi:hypothetical protein